MYIKRIPDSTYYLIDDTRDIFYTITDPSGEYKTFTVITGTAGGLNIISFNAQLAANPKMFETITEQEFNNRKTQMMSALGML